MVQRTASHEGDVVRGPLAGVPHVAEVPSPLHPAQAVDASLFQCHGEPEGCRGRSERKVDEALDGGQQAGVVQARHPVATPPR